ncbi:class I SAM-dependent methyltransferase [Thiolapillus brandeum]|uniref:Methyltransferase n=1 Tax=Thiolapillus brandeum TaxID=1076588 RepID=A0A7U6GI73_9GAMM|nr:class I SAM-dependent methyltransferase [Thiolapillus brandeum]BAO44075.1 methyltransferase [Thiolapillus brandeum]
MDTYSQALQNYYDEKEPFNYEIVRDDGYSSVVPLSIFFEDSGFSNIELLALDRCKGKVLDVGAGAGRHSLELQRRKVNVTAIDISYNAVGIMASRGVEKVIHSDIMDLSDVKYDILLMLMNGIGMVGNPERLDAFLKKSKLLLSKNGIIIFDSVDVLKTDNQKHISYREKNIQNGRLPGQQKLRINYAGIAGEWFNWLHISFNEASQFAKKHGFVTELVNMQENGQYIATLQIKS